MFKLGVILLTLLVQINSALAKVWLLPDYQRKQIYSHRINGEDKERPNNGGGDFSCSNYAGMLDLSAIVEDIDWTDYSYGPKTCCSNWICKSSSF
ncbi:MAG: hypothetical protein IJV97_03580, partial [Alphaproteobacteria bacterium]|nr:hypothetical protein [Alphaproteobacteria bacterium]